MAVPSITRGLSRRATFESGFSETFTNIGGGAGAGAETVTFYQGAQSASRKVTASTDNGFWVNDDATIDMTAAANPIVFLHAFLSDFTDLNATGLRIRIGDTTSDYYTYRVALSDDYGATTSWKAFMINPNLAAYRFATTGTPGLTAVDQYAVTSALATGAAKSENLFVDTIQVGTGIYVTAGDEVSDIRPASLTRETYGLLWDDFFTTAVGAFTQRWGIGQFVDGVWFAQGECGIGENSSGTALETLFREQDSVIVWRAGFVDTDENRIKVNLGNANTTVRFDRVNLSSLGYGAGPTNKWTFYTDNFNYTSDHWGTANPGWLVDPGTFPTGHPYWLYSNEGGTDTTGLTNNTSYWTDFLGQFYTSLSNADAGTSPTTLTLTGTGTERHSLTLNNDTRLKIFQTGTSGTLVIDGCTLTNVNLELTTNGSLVDCVLNTIGRIDLGAGATMDGCTLNSPNQMTGQAVVLTSDLADITNCDFPGEGRIDSAVRSFASTDFVEANGGHAIEIDTAGTYTFTGNTFGDQYEQGEVLFDTETDVTGGATDTIDLGVSTYKNQDCVYYNDDGGTESIGLTDDFPYYIYQVGGGGSTTYSFHINRSDATTGANRVNLTPSAGGSGETHRIYSADAAILNSSNGLVTINVGGGGDSPTFRNTGTGDVVVNNNISVTFSGLIANTEVRVYATADGTELAGVENSGTSFVASVAASTNVYYTIHNVEYEHIRVENFVWPTTDTTIPVQQRFDNNYRNN